MLPRAWAATMGLLLVLFVQIAVAQPPLEQSGRIYLSFEPDRLVVDREVRAFEPFDVYVLIRFDDPQSLPGMFMALGGLRFDESIAFSSYELLDPGHSTLIGLEPGLLQIGLVWSPCPSPPAQLRPIFRMRAVLQEPSSNALIGIEPLVNDDLFGGRGPGWISCGNDRYFVFGQDGPEWPKLTLNRRVATGISSWTMLKATFSGKEQP